MIQFDDSWLVKFKGFDENYIAGPGVTSAETREGRFGRIRWVR